MTSNNTKLFIVIILLLMLYINYNRELTVEQEETLFADFGEYVNLNYFYDEGVFRLTEQIFNDENEWVESINLAEYPAPADISGYPYSIGTKSFYFTNDELLMLSVDENMELVSIPINLSYLGELSGDFSLSQLIRIQVGEANRSAIVYSTATMRGLQIDFLTGETLDYIDFTPILDEINRNYPDNYSTFSNLTINYSSDTNIFAATFRYHEDTENFATGIWATILFNRSTEETYLLENTPYSEFVSYSGRYILNLSFDDKENSRFISGIIDLNSGTTIDMFQSIWGSNHYFASYEGLIYTVLPTPNPAEQRDYRIYYFENDTWYAADLILEGEMEGILYLDNGYGKLVVSVQGFTEPDRNELERLASVEILANPGASGSGIIEEIIAAVNEALPTEIRLTINPVETGLENFLPDVR